MSQTEKQPEHPAQGLIRISRVHGQQRLYKSTAITGSYVSLEVTLAREYVDKDTHSGGHISGAQVIKLGMSHTQFAEMLTSPNRGSGIPCTIFYKDGQRLPDIPDETHKLDRVRLQAEEKIDEKLQEFEEARERVNELLDQKSLRVADRNELRHLFNQVAGRIGESAKWAVRVIDESVEELVTEAKSEINAHVSLVAEQVGVKVLPDMVSTPALTDGLDEGS